ncbi:MAG: hypothetical protein QOE00_2917, partial [Ilumatobacteraceae bacterium]
DLPDEQDDGGVQIRRLRSTTQRLGWLFSSAERPWAPPVADPAITWQLRTLISADPPDVVHGHDWLARSFLPLRRWSARKYGTRFVSTLHYYTLSCAKKNLMRTTRIDGTRVDQPCSGPGPARCLACASRHYGVLTGTVTAVTNLLGATAERRGAGTIVAVSEATARGNGLAVDGDRVVVVPNFSGGRPAPAPTDPDPMAGADRIHTDEVAALVAQLPDREFLLFVGDLRPMKGLDVLLAAFAQMATSFPLVLIGKSWPDTPTVLPAGVEVHDRWPNAAVIEAFRRSAIAVVPSVWAEPFGIVVIEAMAGGTPVVASNIGGIPEIIDDGVSGVLVKPGDAAALRNALTGLIDNPAARLAMGDAARRRADDFKAEAVVPMLEDVYRGAKTRR